MQLFSILGYLSEYNSRFDDYTGEPYANLVASFYPVERKLADRFEAELKAYFKSIHRQYTVTKKATDPGHVSFFDPWLSQRLNSYFEPKKEPGKQIPIYTIDREKLLSAPQGDQLAYLMSSYRRYGCAGACSLSLVNASAKAVTLAHLLIKLGASSVTIRQTTGMVPTSYRIDFDIFTALKACLPELKAGQVVDPHFEEHSEIWKTFT